MNPDEMRVKSNEKIRQIQALMKSLMVEVQAKQKMMPNGFIEIVVIYTDHEQYPAVPPIPQASTPLPVLPEQTPVLPPSAGANPIRVISKDA